MPRDRFADMSKTPTAPAASLAEVVPDDDTDLETVTVALNVATAGTVRVTMADGSVGSVFITAGSVFPMRVKRIWATGTTATGIRALS
jgi:hypothetical protein